MKRDRETEGEREIKDQIFCLFGGQGKRREEIRHDSLGSGNARTMAMRPRTPVNRVLSL